MNADSQSAPSLKSPDWQRVDEAGDAAGFVGYLDTVATRLRERNQELLRLLQVTPGCSVLEVGCGAGDMLIGLAASVERLTAVGIDASDAMIETARARARSAGVEVSFAVGDAQRLDLADESFDRVLCTRVLLHLERPAAAVAEMARVLRPGGRLAIMEPDLDALMIDSDDLAVTRAVRTALADGVRNPDIGRRLRRLLLDAGLSDVEVVPWVGLSPDLASIDQQFRIFDHLEAAVAAGTVSRAAADAWRAGLEAADVSGRFCFAGVLFAAAAGKRAEA